MLCFNCGLKLSSGDVKECNLCGVKFAVKCPSCDFPNPSMAKFCFNCGIKLTKSSEESSVENFDKLEESRKNVAVIFADISGFTALSEKMDPEELRELINDCFNYVTKPVYELEGTIDKYIGDCVMILFGAKYAHSDDAKRAVECSLKMMSLIKDFSEERLSSKGFSLDLSIGVNYGLVVTGSIGNYFDRDYTVIGDIVNTAQRLQSSAGTGNILVSESVYIETKDEFLYSQSRDIIAKNKENPVKCYSPISLNEEYTGSRERLFVGRENEIHMLKSMYSKAVNTKAKCINIIGKAGIGKTKLLKVFSSNIGNDIKKMWIDCNPVTQNRVYFLISSILMNVMNINPQDSNSVKQHRLASFLDFILSSYTDEERERSYDFIGLVMGLGRDNEFRKILDSMSFENIMREIVKHLTVFFVHLCKKYKMLIIVDDMHWADANSIGLLRELIPHMSGSDIVFIFSSRSDIEEIKHQGNNLSRTLKLGMLGEAGIKALSCSLLNCSDICRELFDVIAGFTKGNPLYIVEFVSNIKKSAKFCIRDGVAYADSSEITSIPGNIKSLILANMSEVSDTAKNFLQAASVVGKDFNLSLVKGLLDFEFEDDIIRLPIQLNIISIKSVFTSAGVVEKVFTFNQDIEREAIYESILNKNKKALHKKVGELIEVRYYKDIENYYEILCEHFYSAGLNKKAEEYYYKTALKYQEGFNFTSALAYYQKFLDLVDKKDTDSRIIQVYRDMGHINTIVSSYGRAVEYLNKALELAHLSDDVHSIKLMLANVYKEQGIYDEALGIINEIENKIKQDSNIYGKLLQMKCTVLRITGNMEALSLAKKSEKLLLKTKDYYYLSGTMNEAGIIYLIKGDIDNSLFYLNKAYKYAEKVNNLEVMARASGNIGANYLSTGKTSRALEAFNKAIEISRKISETRGIVTGGANLGILYMWKGMFNKSQELFEQTLEIARETKSVLFECSVLTNLGDLMYEKGDYDTAVGYYRESLTIARSINLPVEEGINYISIAKTDIKLGHYESIPELLEKANGCFEGSGEVLYICDYWMCKSQFELVTGNAGVALEYCEKAISASGECGSDIRKLIALRLKGSIMAALGEYGKAIKLMGEAIELAEQVELDYEVAKGYYSRFEVRKLANRLEEAEEDIKKAREGISKVDKCRWTSIVECAKIRI